MFRECVERGKKDNLLRDVFALRLDSLSDIANMAGLFVDSRVWIESSVWEQSSFRGTASRYAFKHGTP